MTFERYVIPGLLAAVAVAVTRADAASAQEVTQQRPVVVEVPDGFDWLDAGIGAVAAFALVLLVVGIALSVGQPKGGTK
jgi:hypothetical protein